MLTIVIFTKVKFSSNLFVVKKEVHMKSNIEKLQKLRNLAILSKDPLQFGLTSLLIDLEYGTEYERMVAKTKEKIEELTL